MMKSITRSFLIIGALIINTSPIFAEVKHVTDQKELERIIKSGNVVVKCSAQWCGPCKTMKPIFEQVAKESATRSKHLMFIEIDTDKMRKFVTQFKVSGIPSFIYFKDGKEVARTVGAMSKADFQAKVQSTFLRSLS